MRSCSSFISQGGAFLCVFPRIKHNAATGGCGKVTKQGFGMEFASPGSVHLAFMNELNRGKKQNNETPLDASQNLVGFFFFLNLQ